LYLSQTKAIYGVVFCAQIVAIQAAIHTNFPLSCARSYIGFGAAEYTQLGSTGIPSHQNYPARRVAERGRPLFESCGRTRQIGRFPKIEYERWSDGAEQAHQSLEAQANLEAHINDHGCDGDEAAA